MAVEFLSNQPAEVDRLGKTVDLVADAEGGRLRVLGLAAKGTTVAQLLGLPTMVDLVVGVQERLEALQ
jgi:hypothetical protein